METVGIRFMQRAIFLTNTKNNMAPAKKKIIQSPQEPASCMVCAKCQLLQWGNDPIIADCEAKHTREVANGIRQCASFEKSKNLPKEIKHLPKKYGLIMD